MNKRIGYFPEVHECAVRMILTGEHKDNSRCHPIQSVAANIGCISETQ